mgnify:CR=1 FL=1
MAEDTDEENCLRNAVGILKIWEVISLVICTSSVGYYLDHKRGDFDKRKSLEFFVIASVIAMSVVGLFILIWLFEIHKRTGTILSLLAIFMLVASSLLADFDRADCDDEENSDVKSQCSQITAGVVFGFSATIALIVDGIVSCCRSVLQEDDDSSNNSDSDEISCC